jgi:hypothetical protein
VIKRPIGQGHEYKNMAALAALLDEAPSLQASNQQEMGRLEAENNRLREETASLKARFQNASFPDVP